jgi:hypothetical protein
VTGADWLALCRRRIARLTAIPPARPACGASQRTNEPLISAPWTRPLTHTVSAAIWFGITTGYLTLAAATTSPASSWTRWAGNKHYQTYTSSKMVYWER